MSSLHLATILSHAVLSFLLLETKPLAEAFVLNLYLYQCVGDQIWIYSQISIYSKNGSQWDVYDFPLLEIGDFFGINTDLQIDPDSIPYHVIVR